MRPRPLQHFAAWIALVSWLPFGAQGIAAAEIREPTPPGTEFQFFVRALPDRAVIYACNPVSGSPVEGVQVEARMEDRTETVKTDHQGIARIERPTAGTLIATFRGRVETHDLAGFPSEGEALIYLTHERMIYRAGQAVRWKAVCRERKGSSFTFVPGAKLQVELQLQPLEATRTTTATLNEFGSASGSFELPKDMTLGFHGLRIPYPSGAKSPREPEGVWSGFRVESPQNPEMRVSVEFPDDAPLLGEKIPATVRVESSSGQPAAGVAVQWWVVGGRGWKEDESPWPAPRWDDPRFRFFFRPERQYEQDEWDHLSDSARREGRTGQDGELEISFDSKAGSEVRLFIVNALVAAPSGREIQGRAWIQAAPASLGVTLDAGRVFCLEGDRVKSAARVRHRRGGAGGAIPVKLEAFRDGLGKGSVDSRPFASWEGKTDPGGLASFEFLAERAGRIRVRARATDAQGRSATDQTVLWIAGRDVDLPWTDQLVNILPDRFFYEEGDTVRLLVRSTLAPFPALLTVEGHEIREARLVRIGSRWDLLEFPWSETLAPAALVQLSAWKGRQSACGAFEVLGYPRGHALEVRITSDRPSCRTGDKLKIAFTTRVNGKPIPAELEVSVQAEAPFAMEPEGVEDIQSYFRRCPDRDLLSDGNMWASIRRYSRFHRFHRHADMPVYHRGEGGTPWGMIVEGDFWIPDTLLWEPHLKTRDDGQAEVEIEVPGGIPALRVTTRGVAGADHFGWARACVPVSR